MDAMGLARAFVAVALLAVVPGYVWSLVLLPAARGLERALFAVMLSVILVILAAYLGNTLLGIAISPSHAVWSAVGLTLGGWAALAWRRRSPAPS